MLDLLASELIDIALKEDIGTGDLSSLILSDDTLGEARIFAKAQGVVCGLSVVQAVFARVEPQVRFDVRVQDGDTVAPGDLVIGIEGRLARILQAERTALNFLQHLSGVATATARVVQAVEGYNLKVIDTRKTLPGMRALQKYAVRIGGGQNHRFGLYDAVILKDNHLAAVGGLAEAMKRVRREVGPMVKIEVECETLQQVREAVECQADVIMLDNMSIPDMREAVKHIAGRAVVEASGGINESNIRDIAATGVDVVSLGRLTHSVKALDFSMVIDEAKPSIQQIIDQAKKR